MRPEWAVSNVGPLKANKQTTKFTSAKLQKFFFFLLKIQTLQGKQCRYIYEAANDHPPCQDVRCLKILLFSSLAF